MLLYIIILFFPSIYNFLKFNLTATRKLSSESYFSGSMTNIFNIHYNFPLYVGSSMLEYRVIIDTGSTWLWLGSSKCTECKNSGIARLYDCEKSDFCIENSNDELEIQYGIGNVKGFVAKDQVSLDKNGIFSINQTFLQVTELKEINEMKGEGILGLGKSENHYKGILYGLKEAKIIDKMLFSLYLSPSECLSLSKLTIGNIDESLFEGKIIYTPVISFTTWTIEIQEMTLISNKNNIKKIDNVFKRTLIDSGSSEIVLNKAAMYSFIKFLEEIQIKCELIENYQNVPQLTCHETNMEQYPDINFIIENENFIIKPDAYFANCYFLRFKYVCRLHLILDESLETEELIVLGDTFLHRYYSIYDLENNVIGLAKAKLPQNIKGENKMKNIIYFIIIYFIYHILLYGIEYLVINKNILNKIENSKLFTKIYQDPKQEIESISLFNNKNLELASI